MYEIKATARFKKDIKLLQKRGYNIALLQQVIEILARLLIYRIDEDILILTLTRTGTHSDLF